MQEKEELNKVWKYCNERNIVYLSEKPKTYFEYYIIAKTNRIVHLIKGYGTDVLIWPESPRNDNTELGYELFYEGYDDCLINYKDTIYYYFGL